MDKLALVATTHFFTSVVDDTYEFGRIAATNPLSDIYAIGGTLILALLNSMWREAAVVDGVHAVADVTGFRLLNPLLEICCGSRLAARVCLLDVPMLRGAADLMQDSVATGVANRNWAGYDVEVVLPDCEPDWQRSLLCNQQTSEGLLIAVSTDMLEPLPRHARGHQGGKQSSIMPF